jgi:hypothetical protein
MILAFADPKVLARIVATGAMGFLAGSLFISAWGGPKKKAYGLLGFVLPFAIGLCVTGLRPSASLITIGLFVALLQIPVLNSCSQAIWQTKTEPGMQGRVFGIRMMIAWFSNPLAYFLAGPLAEHVFEPLMAVHGFLAGTWLKAIGTGPGRGIGLFLVLNGLVALIGTTGCYWKRRLWRLEDEVPDAASQQVVSAVSVAG